MIPFAFALLLAQAAACTGRGAASIASARAQAEALNLAGAADAFDAAVAAGCQDARLSALYLRGWIAARDAYRLGGSPESLAPVRKVLDELEAGPAVGETEIASFVLRAAIAAAQSERDEMALLIEHAVDLEARRRSASLPGAPIVTAHEAAGELWLQVYRYDDARRAYRRAADRIGPTRRVIVGLARTAARMSDSAGACTQYRALLAGWRADEASPEVAEARAFVRQASCEAVGVKPRQ